MTRREARGFSLLEVLVAFAVLALVAGAALHVFAAAARQSALVRHHMEAVLVAESRLAECGIGAALEAGSQSGVVSGRYRWRRDVEPYAPAAAADEREAPVARYRIRVEVRWEEDGRARAVSLSTVRLSRAG